MARTRFMVWIVLGMLGAIGIVSCRKENENPVLTLPEKTQSGKNTFGFLLDQSVWTNYGKVCFPFAGGCRENLRGVYVTGFGSVDLSADKVLSANGSWSQQDNLSLALETRFRGTGVYDIAQGDEISVGLRQASRTGTEREYLLSSVRPTFRIQLTRLDTVQRILSGEFSGVLFRRLSEFGFDTSPTDSLVISAGRFDIRYE